MHERPTKPIEAALHGKHLFPSERGSRVALCLLLLGIFLAGSSIRPVVPTATDSRRALNSGDPPLTDEVSGGDARERISGASPGQEADLRPAGVFWLHLPLIHLPRVAPASPPNHESPDGLDGPESPASPALSPPTMTLLSFGESPGSPERVAL